MTEVARSSAVRRVNCQTPMPTNAIAAAAASGSQVRPERAGRAAATIGAFPRTARSSLPRSTSCLQLAQAKKCSSKATASSSPSFPAR